MILVPVGSPLGKAVTLDASIRVGLVQTVRPQPTLIARLTHYVTFARTVTGLNFTQSPNARHGTLGITRAQCAPICLALVQAKVIIFTSVTLCARDVLSAQALAVGLITAV